MSKKKCKKNAGMEVVAIHQGQPRANQCALPLWSIDASPDYSRGKQISDPGATPVIIFLTQMSAKQQSPRCPMHKPLSRQSQRLSLADALSSQKRRVSHVFLFFFFILPLFPSQTVTRVCKPTHGPLHLGRKLHRRSAMLLNS